MFHNILKQNPNKYNAEELYKDIVEQSRKMEFYSILGVPDSVDGRFEMISLHMTMVLRRLKKEGEALKNLAQELFDAMFRNMDHSLREMGVGDLKVGTKVRKLAEDFYGRLGAYNEALDKKDESALCRSIKNNIFEVPEDKDEQKDNIKKLADYVLRSEQKLSEQSKERILLGFISFPDPIN